MSDCQRYRVDWSGEHVVDEMAKLITLLSPGRGFLVSLAERWVTALLEVAPEKFGRELSEGLWQLRLPPFAVGYSIDDDTCAVRIEQVALLTGP